MKSSRSPLVSSTSFLLLMLLWSVVATEHANAHPLAPFLLKIELISEHSASLFWKESELKPQGIQVGPIFPEDCHKISVPDIQQTNGSSTYQWSIDCKHSLIERSIRIEGLEASRGNVLVAFTDASGNAASTLLTGENNNFIIPKTLNHWRIAKNYVFSGIEHLLLGWDHLLFVTGLFVLLFHQIKRLLFAITAFTAGHSITLLLASMGYLPFNPQWVEILIALSITALGLELLSTEKPAQRFSIRKSPYLLTFFFGLIHGCGFASVLAEALSKEAQVALPLFSFNLGIEIGQGIVLLALTALFYPFIRIIKTNIKQSNGVAGYVLGAMSVYWLISRISI